MRLLIWVCAFAGMALSQSALGGEPAAGKWELAEAMPEPRQESGAAALGNTIYLIGGYGADGVASTLVQAYDGETKKWKQVAAMPEGLHHAGVAGVGGKLYVVGGFTKTFRDRGPVDSVWQYDPAVDRWSRRAPMPTPRGALAVAVLDGKIYALGGERFAAAGSKDKYEAVADAAVYDPATDKWEPLPAMLQKRDHLVAGALNGKIYAVGGRARPDYTLRNNEEYDPAARAWRDRAPMLFGRSGGAGAVLQNRLYVFGGEGNDENPLGVFNQAQAYDAARDAWAQLPSMPLPRHALAAVAVGKKIYLPGGSIVQGGRAPGTTAIMDSFEPN